MGSGFRTFATSEVLTASNVQNYLMDQAVMSFASSGARSIAISAPEEGMLAYLRDDDTLYSYNGTVWVPASSLVPHTSTTNPTAHTSATTTSTTYVNLPGSTALSFSKYRGDTTLVVTMSNHGDYTTGSSALFHDFAVRVNSVDYLVHRLGLAASVRHSATGQTSITGLAIGTYTVQPRVKISGAGGTINWDSDCYHSFSVTETL